MREGVGVCVLVYKREEEIKKESELARKKR